MNKDIQKDLKMLYQGTDLEKLEQPEDHSKLGYRLLVLSGIVWLIFILYIWYLINITI